MSRSRQALQTQVSYRSASQARTSSGTTLVAHQQEEERKQVNPAPHIGQVTVRGVPVWCSGMAMSMVSVALRLERLPERPLPAFDEPAPLGRLHHREKSRIDGIQLPEIVRR